MPQLVTSRQALAVELGGFIATNTSSSTGSASTVELSKELLSSVLPATMTAYAWVYVPSLAATGIAQARITAGGLNPATGIVTLEGALGAPTVLAGGTAVELHALLPAVDAAHAYGGGSSLLSCLNRALRHLFRDDDSLTIELVSGQQDYSLAAYSDFLDRADLLRDVRVGNASGTTTVSTAHHWEYREGSGGPHLHFSEPYAFLAGAPSMTLVVRRRCDSLIRVGGVWGASTVGLANETDEAMASVNDTVTVALWLAYLALAARNHGQARATYLARAEAQLALAQRINGFEVGEPAPAPPVAPVAAPAGAAA